MPVPVPQEVEGVVQLVAWLYTRGITTAIVDQQQHWLCNRVSCSLASHRLFLGQHVGCAGR